MSKIEKIKNALESPAGFTLVELLVSLAISVVILAGLTSVFMTTNEQYTEQSKLSDVQQGIRAAMQVMSRDLRMAGLNPANATCPGIYSNNSTSINVRYDYNGDGSCDRDRIFRYDASNNTLNMQPSSNGSMQVLAEDITSFSFGYTPNATNVRMVNIGICGKISGAYADNFDTEYCFNSSVRCRNMGL
ncbi:MAG: PilW family protein [Desulfonatronovibrionaceae bacterium]